MHPRELLELRHRAAAASMSLTAYVAALLASDADDVARPVRNPRINWLEDNSGATVARRCGLPVDPGDTPELGPRCSRPIGHPGSCGTGALS